MATIAIVDLCFNWPPQGGSWVDVKNIAQRLQLLGHTPVLFVPRLDYGFPRGRIEEPLPFPVRQIAFSRYSFNLIAAPARFRRAIEPYSPDFVFITDGYFLKPFIIHALRRYRTIVRFYAYEIFCIQNNRFVDGRICASDLQGAGRAACEECRRLRYPLVPGLVKLFRNEPQYFVFHEYLMSLAFLPCYRRIFRRSAMEAERVIVYNETQKEMLRQYTTRISVVPSGVDTKLFAPRPRKKGGPFTIGLSGRFYEEAKGLEVALGACRVLRAEGWEFQVRIASPYDIRSKDEFVRYCGWYSRDKLPDFYSQCDVVVIPSLWEEPFGITAVEALSCGVPVIASSIGGLSAIVEDGKSGMIFRSGDAKDLSDKIRQLLKDPERARSISAAARDRAVSAFDWDVIMRSYYLPFFEMPPEKNE